MLDKILTVIIILFIGCDDSASSKDEYPPNFLELYMNTILDDNLQFIVY